MSARKSAKTTSQTKAIAANYESALAREAGLTSIAYLLESVALEAGAEAATRQWPADNIAER